MRCLFRVARFFSLPRGLLMVDGRFVLLVVRCVLFVLCRVWFVVWCVLVVVCAFRFVVIGHCVLLVGNGSFSLCVVGCLVFVVV